MKSDGPEESFDRWHPNRPLLGSACHFAGGLHRSRRERFDFPFGEPIARHVWQTQKSSEIREDGAGPSRNRRPRSAGIYPQLAVGRNYSGAERVRGRRALADADPEKRIARTTL